MIIFNIFSSIIKNSIDIFFFKLQNELNKFEKNTNPVRYPKTLDLTQFCSVASPVSTNVYVFSWKVVYINCITHSIVFRL